MFQHTLMSERVKGYFVPEYWVVFIIRDIPNGTEGVIENHVILKVNGPCVKVQYQRYVTGMSITITNKDAKPGLGFQCGIFDRLVFMDKGHTPDSPKLGTCVVYEEER